MTPDMALLFLTLDEPGPVPIYLESSRKYDLEKALLRLVLEGVLELEDEGSFVSGVEASNRLFDVSDSRNGSHLAALSIRALQYGQSLGSIPLPDLTRRLYDYGRKAVSPVRARQFCCEAAVEEFLGLSDSGRAQSIIRKWWFPVNGSDSYWKMWRPKRREPSDGAVKYKLYVSPTWKSLAEAFLASAEVFAQTPGLRGLKIARDVRGLSRSDKLVGYFSRFDDLQEAASRLHRRLNGSDVHGVPFTAEITSDGLLSWGADPPLALIAAQPTMGRSWRFWIASQLAQNLLAPLRREPASQRWKFALNKLRVDGVDTNTWVPEGRLWERALSGAIGE